MKSAFAWHGRELVSHLKQVKRLIEAQGENVFTELFDLTNLTPSNYQGALMGATVTIKATFDVAGYHTTGGSKLLGVEEAKTDASAVSRLRHAGAILLGHTNMTELAYSGLGLNPHFGTPENPTTKGAIPGGSTSGGAVSVAIGIADIALGTDTGGSLRIPAAFCGVTGFKPSQSSVSRQGCLPLSDELDCVGPIAKDVASCRLAWRVLAGQRELSMLSSSTLESDLRLVVPTNFGLDNLDMEVELGFKQMIERLQTAGFTIEYRAIDLFEQYKKLPVWQFSAYESQRYYRQYFAIDSEQLDPRVRQRMARSKEVSEQTFADTCQLRQALIHGFQTQEPNSVFILPTVACAPPMLSELEQDADYDRMNLLCLRNTTFANVVDGCSISLPFQYAGVPQGLMLTALNGLDEALLQLALTFEKHLKKLQD